MTLDQLLTLQPYLYHLTAAENARSILARGEILSARAILAAAGHVELLRDRRTKDTVIKVAEASFRLRDQRPLQLGSIQLERGTSFEEFVEILNSLVFFWPGGVDGPIEMARNHFERYMHESPAMLRVRLDDLVQANPSVEPKVSACNSGAPRCNPVTGKGVRGPNTFVTLDRFQGSAGVVREVVFADRVVLPAVEVGTLRAGRWVSEQGSVGGVRETDARRRHTEKKMPKATTCRLNGETITVADALRLRDQAGSRYPEFRCVSCGELVRPHKTGTTGQGAHFEHRKANPRCPLRA